MDLLLSAMSPGRRHASATWGWLWRGPGPTRSPPAQASCRLSAGPIVGVTPGSPAAESGLIVGDILVEFDGEPIDSADSLLELLAGDRVGREVSMRILRGGESGIVAIRVAERPRP